VLRGAADRDVLDSVCVALAAGVAGRGDACAGIGVEDQVAVLVGREQERLSVGCGVDFGPRDDGDRAVLRRCRLDVVAQALLPERLQSRVRLDEEVEEGRAVLAVDLRLALALVGVQLGYLRQGFDLGEGDRLLRREAVDDDGADVGRRRRDRYGRMERGRIAAGLVRS
jgi:hypothetical protein